MEEVAVQAVQRQPFLISALDGSKYTYWLKK
jgi:hypothetical protein